MTNKDKQLKYITLKKIKVNCISQIRFPQNRMKLVYDKTIVKINFVELIYVHKTWAAMMIILFFQYENGNFLCRIVTKFFISAAYVCVIYQGGNAHDFLCTQIVLSHSGLTYDIVIFTSICSDERHKNVYLQRDFARFALQSKLVRQF